MMQKKYEISPNHLLREERLHHQWSQKDVADLIGTTTNNVSRWELGQTSPGPYFRTKLCKLFSKEARDLGYPSLDLPQSSMSESMPKEGSSKGSALNEQTSKVPYVWNVPYRRNPWFTGREALLKYLAQFFFSTSEPVALTGMGGIGKTQIALEYAYRFRHLYRAILWIRAETSELLHADFQMLTNNLPVPEPQEQVPQQRIDAIKHWLSNHVGWLLVFDDVKDLSIINKLLPTGCTGHILITAQLQSLGTLAHQVEIGSLLPNDALLFLLRRAKHIPHNALLQTASDAERNAATAIIDVFDGLPLALDQAGSYIEASKCDLSDYLNYYQQKPSYFLAERGFGDGTHPYSVAKTIRLAFSQLERLHPIAANLLRLCTFFHPKAIPEEIFALHFSDPMLISFTENPIAWEATVAALRSYSLLSRCNETKTLSLHHLVQTVVRDQIDLKTQPYWLEKVVMIVNRAFLDQNEDKTLVQSQRIFPHVQACTQFMKQWPLSSLDARQLLEKRDSYLQKRIHSGQNILTLSPWYRSEEHEPLATEKHWQLSSVVSASLQSQAKRQEPMVSSFSGSCQRQELSFSFGTSASIPCEMQPPRSIERI